MREIPLTQGQVAIVSDKGFEIVSQYKWYAHRDRGNYYAETSSRDENGKRRTISMHRLIMGAKPGEQVDHICGATLDNREENLRICSNTQNLRNQRKLSTRSASSRYKGVSWRRPLAKWQAYIMVDGRSRYLGLFAIEEDAAIAYDAAARLRHSEFAALNFPRPGERSAINGASRIASEIGGTA